MTAWDMDERVYKYLMSSPCKAPEDTLVWLPKKDPTSKLNILMLVMDKNAEEILEFMRTGNFPEKPSNQNIPNNNYQQPVQAPQNYSQNTYQQPANQVYDPSVPPTGQPPTNQGLERPTRYY